MTTQPSTNDSPTASNLFYQTRLRREVLDRGEGVYLYDTQGRQFIDGSSGAMVSNIGHSNPRVLAAMRAQMDKATFGYRLHFEVEPAEKLASKTAELCGADLDRVFFTSGGSETVESCIKLARQYALATDQAQRYKLVSRFPSYHGGTLGVLGLTGYTPLTAPFDPMLNRTPKIPAPTARADGLDPDLPATGHHYAQYLEQCILAEGPDTVLAFVVEPVGGASTGALVPPVGYMQRIREICDRYGVLLIHDEVMSGGGRTGRFLAGDHWQVKPDILAVSKGFAAGYAPLGAMVARRPLVDAVLDDGGFMHGYTYAGNPLACAAGLAVINEIESQNLMENAVERGEELKAQLKTLQDDYEFIGDVRGMGLLLAFELVDNREQMSPLPASLNAAQRLTDIAYDNQLILYNRRTRGGLYGDHCLVCPPMIVSSAEIAELMKRLRAAIDQLAKELKLS